MLGFRLDTRYFNQLGYPVLCVCVRHLIAIVLGTFIGIQCHVCMHACGVCLIVIVLGEFMPPRFPVSVQFCHILEAVNGGLKPPLV